MQQKHPQTQPFLGVEVPKGLLAVQRGNKYQEQDAWFLTTRNGVFIARFGSETDLDDWWRFFQVKWSRTPRLRQKPPHRATLAAERQIIHHVESACIVIQISTVTGGDRAGLGRVATWVLGTNDWDSY